MLKGMTKVAAAALLKTGWLGPLLVANGHLKGFYCVEFLASAVQSGAVAAMADGPRTLAQLTDDLAVAPEMVDGLHAWLDLGCALGLLGRSRDGYRLRGQAKTLAKTENDPLAAYYTELSTLHHRVMAEAPHRWREAWPLEVAEVDAAVIARASRLSAPYIEAGVRQVVTEDTPQRLVEIGCGSGLHIKTAANLNPSLTVLGLDVQEAAVAQARRNMDDWGLSDRVTIEQGDVRDRPGNADADVVTLHQNVYYFARSERAGLMRHLAGHLKPGGRLLVTTMCRGRGGGHATAALDLWAAMTRGADRLPVRAELAEHLTTAGYVDVDCDHVTPDGLFCVAVGTKPGASGSAPETADSL